MNTETKTTQTELYNRFKSTTTKSIIHLTEHIFYFSLFLYEDTKQYTDLYF